MTPEIITTVNESIEKLQHELSTIKAEEKTVRAALAAFEAKPRLSDLRQSIERLKEERDALQAKLPSFQEGAVEMQPQEREKLEQDWKQWQRHTTLRRRMCQDLWGKCTEILPDNMTLQELWVRLLCMYKAGISWRVLKWSAGIAGTRGDPPMRGSRVWTLSW